MSPLAAIPRLRWKIFLVFGLLSIFAVAAASAITYYQAEREFRRSLGEKLASVSAAVLDGVDPDQLTALTSVETPEYDRLKRFVDNLRRNLGMAWIAIYRHNGEFFTNIVDGAEMGEGFTLDMPIFDVAPELEKAWTDGVPVAAENYQDAYGQWKSFFRPIKDRAGRVVAVIDVSESNISLERFTDLIVRKTIAVIVAVAAFALLVSLAFSGTLSGPIARLTEGAGRLAAGDFATRVAPTGGRDEIARLIDSFNTMGGELEAGREALSRRLFELSTLFEVSQKVNQAKNTRELLQLILDRAVTAVGAARGSVLLFDDDTQTLTLDVVAGPGVGEAKPGIRLAPGEGVAGRVFQEMKPLLLNEGLAEVFKPYRDGTMQNVRNILCVPLVVDNRSIGVINLVNKQKGAFGDGDLNLMQTMASQVALTIEKSRLYDLSITDGMTGLYIHRFFQIAFDRELKRSKRYKSEVSMVMFDIDHFKSFNDTWGHQQGDIVIAGVAALIRQTIRENDIAARYGGEEFALILPETALAGAYELAERIRKRVEAHDFPGQERPLKVTVSLGVAQYPRHATDKMALIKQADAALYRSKEGGRNRTTVAEDPVAGEREPSA